MVIHHLKKINLSKFISDNVTKMECMFYGCKLLEEIDLSHLNTSNIIDMSYLFGN